MMMMMMLMMMMEMESHGMMRQAQPYKKKTAQQLRHGPLSARRELQSHPLAGQAQARGRLTKGGWARGPDGTYRDHWCSHCTKKKKLLTRHPCAGGHVNLSVSFHWRSTNCACHPYARAMQFSPCEKRVKKLQERVAPFVLLRHSNHACHPCTKGHAKFLCSLRWCMLS